MVYVNHCSLCFAKQLPLEVGLYQDDFSDEKSVLTDTKRKTAFLLFFASTDGLRLPRIQTYIAKKSFIILIFYSPFLNAPLWKACKKSQKNKRITGIEPASPAWEAGVLPMYYIRTFSSINLFFKKCNRRSTFYPGVWQLISSKISSGLEKPVFFCQIFQK